MFDTLVESTKVRRNGKAGRYFVLTTMLYGLGLVGVAIGTIIGFSPVLAEEFTLESMLASPPVPSAPPKFQARINPRQPDASPNIFAPPVRPATKALPASELKDRPPVITGGWVPGGSTGDWRATGGGIPGGRASMEVIPPPPAPKATPPPAEEPKETLKISKGVLQGMAIRKVKPQYTAIARQVRAAGAVQVLVTISEEGRVIEAAAIEGHPMLRSVAVEAARQWLFSPTLLSGAPVRVQGVLTFNFTLQ